jgi:hypothetical protein
MFKIPQMLEGLAFAISSVGLGTGRKTPVTYITKMPQRYRWYAEGTVVAERLLHPILLLSYVFAEVVSLSQNLLIMEGDMSCLPNVLSG